MYEGQRRASFEDAWFLIGIDCFTYIRRGNIYTHICQPIFSLTQQTVSDVGANIPAHASFPLLNFTVHPNMPRTVPCGFFSIVPRAITYTTSSVSGCNTSRSAS